MIDVTNMRVPELKFRPALQVRPSEMRV